MDAHANFAVSAVATAPSPATSGTSLVVTATEGARFPATPFNAVICPTGVLPTPANAEIVRVTNIATDTLTITRAQEGSTARTVVVGDLIYAAVTAKTLTDVEAGAWIAVPKNSDQSISSSVSLTNDSELSFATVNGGVYEIEMVIIYANPASGGTVDMKVAAGEDATNRGVLLWIGVANNDVSNFVQAPSDQTQASGVGGTATTKRVITMSGGYIGGGGTFHFLWAQATSSGNPTVVYAGSVLRYRRVA